MSEQYRDLVDPSLKDLLAIYPTETISVDNLHAWRARSTPLQDVPDADVHLRVRGANGLKGAPDVELRIYRPKRLTAVLGCVLHIHGGGFVAGQAADLEPLDRALSYELGCVIVTVNYRLAPETTFPGNVEDCYAALSWIFSHADELGIDPNRIGLLGESAGGGLAAALALLARDRGEFRPAFQHLIYPMLDDRTCVADDPHPYTGNLVWTRQNNYFGWQSLLGKEPGATDVSPYAAPARASTLEGLPPTFIFTAALDLFLEENLEYARRLTRAGVPTELHVYPGAFHGFDLHPTADVSCAARRTSLAALSRFLNTTAQNGASNVTSITSR